jgi:hypothetical protein
MMLPLVLKMALGWVLGASLITWVTFRCGSWCGCCSRAVARARGLEMRALDGVSKRSLAVSGVDLLHRSNVLDLRKGTVQGIYSWGSALGDGDLMRRRFRVVCGSFFLGGRGRGRGVPGRVLLRSFRRTAGSKQPLFVLYIIC